MAMNSNTINDDVTMGGSAQGTLLAGRYRAVRQLGQGGMGSVWLAEDTQLDNRPVALKLLPSILVSNKRAYAQLKAEALVSLKLSHPNIVTLRAFEENSGNPFLVMDYIEGQTLDDYLAEKGTLTEEETLTLLKPIAAALDYAHGQGVVHRDVKPANVMIQKDGTPFILDFGIAREIQETVTRVTGKLSSGTLLYMSPEQLMGEKPTPVQDIYSFSAMVYECLKGEPPFARGAIEDQIKNKLPEPLPGGIGIAPSVMAGLSKKPEDRPQNCADVLAGGVPQKARQPGGSGRRLDGALKVLLAVLAIGLASACWSVWRHQQEQVRIAEEAARQKAVAAEIRIEAKVRMDRIADISDMDGFKERKAALSGEFAQAEVLFDENTRRWTDAAQGFSNCVVHAEALVRLDGERQAAVQMRAKAEKAKRDASQVEPEKCAPDTWKTADMMMKSANDEFQRMRFALASNTFASAAAQFGKCAEESVAERMRQEKAAATDIRIEAKVRMDRIAGISDGDGFKERKAALSGEFAQAEAFFDENTRRWTDAVQGFSNYVAHAEALVRLDGERQAAAQARADAEKARELAVQADAEKYVTNSWNKAIQLMESANGEFQKMHFAAASNTFASVVAPFKKCAEEAKLQKSEATKRRAYNLFESGKYEELLQGMDMRECEIPDVLYLQGLVYSLGLTGTPEFAKALQKMEAASKAGYALATVNLGTQYCGGDLVKKDVVRGTNLVEKGKLEVERLANAGNPYAQDLLGLLHSKGWGCASNMTVAAHWFKRASEKGYVAGLADYGECLLEGEGTGTNTVMAVELLEKAYAKGSITSAVILGFHWYKKDNSVAAEWFRRCRRGVVSAAEQGHSWAQFGAGLLDEKGLGCETNNYEAVRWYTLAAEQGHIVAQNNLGLMYFEGRGVASNDWIAVKWFRKAAEQGCANSQHAMGVAYSEGRGVEKDYGEALRWYTLAAEQGTPLAQFELGLMYFEGRGVASNDWTAVKWLRKAADQGVAIAQTSMGFAYSEGRGVEKDYGEALRWYTRAAEQAEAIAQNNLGFMYWEGRGVPQNDWTAVGWFRKAAEQGYPNSQHAMGVACEDGRGVAKNRTEAIRWYRKAAEQGYEDAKAGLKRLGIR